MVLCPGGPALVRGEVVIQDEDGNEHRSRRPVTALCRCTRSAAKPWCDGTHKELPEKLRP
jgi:CDGSH-type Zn-finger protein